MLSCGAKNTNSSGMPYTIIGFCNVDNKVVATRYVVVKGNNVTENFTIQVQMAMESASCYHMTSLF